MADEDDHPVVPPAVASPPLSPPQEGTPPTPKPPPASQPLSPAKALPQFDPSRMIGVIKRKALIKELAATYHAECLSCCRELLDLQKEWEESYTEMKALEEPRRETSRLPKRTKKNY